MTLGEKMRELRKSRRMSQETVAELVGISRQAVNKWERDQSTPSTENLFKLAEILGTSVDQLLCVNAKSDDNTLAAQVYALYKAEQAQKRVAHIKQLKKNLLFMLCTLSGYLLFYILGRCIWRGDEQSMFGWLFSEMPRGPHSYLYGWLLSSSLFYISAAISALPSLLGKYRFSLVTGVGFLVGFLAGLVFGPNPQGDAYGNGHYGWAIWIVIFFISIIVGIAVEILTKHKAYLTALIQKIKARE